MTREEQWLFEEKYNGVESEAFHADLKRLAAGEPLGYVIGFVPFLNCKIWLENKPLIPRPETEYWVEKTIEEMRSTEASPLCILDLCAGSGAIGIAVAKAIPESHVTFAEIDKALLPTIGKNLEGNDIVCTRYKVFQSDLFENIDGQYDFILTNPPYINKAANTVAENVEKYEPHLALFGGVEGIEYIEKIIEGARAKLAPHGQLWIEHEPEQSAAIQTLATIHKFTTITHKDQYEVERYSILVIQ